MILFEYQNSLKEVEKIQKLIRSIENNEENSSYRLEINIHARGIYNG